jgi:protein disulfide-isomerase
MKTIISFLCALGLLAVAARAAENEAQWNPDFKASLAKAKETQRPLLVNFTGSDWCPWCIKLHDEIFEKPEFKEYAKEKLVLSIIDFPRKTEQPAEVKKANAALRDKYGVKGYPTVVVFDSDGKKIGELGYVDGGPKAFLAELEKALKTKPADAKK